jgi:hypothetical protein
MRIMFALLCLSLLAACGSNSGVAEAPHNADQPVSGVIVIEERLGKRVFDAWFSRTLIPESDDSPLWQSGSEHCDSLVTLARSGALMPPAAREPAGLNWRQTLFAGDAIEISSRTGTVIRLYAQHYGDAVVYASDERWLAAALPDDSRLTVPGSDVFPAFESIALMPLIPLLQEHPADGLLVEPGAPIVWQVSGNTNDRVELTVTHTAELASGSGLQFVRCSLDDSGSFTLPEVVQAVMSGESQIHVSLVRKRETNYRAGNASMTLVQLSYP